MSADTQRVALRLKTDIHETSRRLAEEGGMDHATYLQKIIVDALLPYLPEERRSEIEREKRFLEMAQAKARNVYFRGGADSHFTLTVVREMMDDPETRKLYEEIIGGDAYDSSLPGKMPINLYLGWTIKNSVSCRPLLNDKGKVARAFVKDEPIKSYTLLEFDIPE